MNHITRELLQTATTVAQNSYPALSYVNNASATPGNAKHLECPTQMLNNIWDTSTRVLPSVEDVCPEEAVKLAWLQEVTHSIETSMIKQQLLTVEGWNGFAPFKENTTTVPSKNPTILRVRIFNTHHNQLSSLPAIDSFSTEDLTNIPPPRWVLRIQGKTIGESATASAKSSTLLSPKLTSFFSKIIVSTSTETVIWDRQSQLVQNAQQSYLKTMFARYCNSSEETKASSSNIALAATDAINEHLVDFDCLELCRTGDEDERVNITFLPYYKFPHYSLSSELESIVGSPIATLTDICHAIWLRCKYVQSKSSEDSSHQDHSHHNVPISPPPSQSSDKNQDSSWCMSKNAASHDTVNQPLKISTGLFRFQCDARLQQVFNLPPSQNLLNIEELYNLLKPHLFPPRPTTVTHTIRVNGNIVDNETVYDFPIGPSLLDSNNNNNNIFLPLSSPLQPWLSSTTVLSKADIEKKSHRDTFLSECNNNNNDSNFLISTELKDTWNCLRTALLRRRLLLKFSKEPINTMISLLASHYEEPFNNNDKDYDDDSFEITDWDSNFYKEPWVLGAADAYLRYQGTDVEDLISRNLSANASERRRSIQIHQQQQQQQDFNNSNILSNQHFNDAFGMNKRYYGYNPNILYKNLSSLGTSKHSYITPSLTDITQNNPNVILPQPSWQPTATTRNHSTSNDHLHMYRFR